MHVNRDGSINVATGGGSAGSVVVGMEGVASSITGSVSVGNTKTGVIASNTDRKFAVFTNDSNEVIYLSLGNDAVMNMGIRLNASGGAYEINQTNLYTGSVTAICNTGTKNLTFSEG